MKASEMADFLGRLIRKYGDLPVQILDDESGEYEDVAGIVPFYGVDNEGRRVLQMMTERQAER